MAKQRSNNQMPLTLQRLLAAANSGAMPEAYGGSVLVGRPMFNPNDLDGIYTQVDRGSMFNPESLDLGMLRSALQNAMARPAGSPQRDNGYSRGDEQIAPPELPPVVPARSLTGNRPGFQYVKPSLGTPSAAAEGAATLADWMGFPAGEGGAATADRIQREVRESLPPPAAYSFGRFGPPVSSQDRLTAAIAAAAKGTATAMDKAELGFQPSGVLSPRARNNAMAVLNEQDRMAAAESDARRERLYGGAPKLQGQTTMTSDEIAEMNERIDETRRARIAAANDPAKWGRVRQRDQQQSLTAAGVNPLTAALMAPAVIQERMGRPQAAPVDANGQPIAGGGIMNNPAMLNIAGFHGAAQAVQQQQYMAAQQDQQNAQNQIAQGRLKLEERLGYERAAAQARKEGRYADAEKYDKLAGVPSSGSPGFDPLIIPPHIQEQQDPAMKNFLLTQYHAANGHLSPEVNNAFLSAYNMANSSLSGSWSNPDTYNKLLDHMVQAVLPSGTPEQKANVRKMADQWFNSANKPSGGGSKPRPALFDPGTLTPTPMAKPVPFEPDFSAGLGSY